MARILVVDDKSIFRDPIAAGLRLAGHVAMTASDGCEALGIARRERPDLILLDVAMPVMDGLTCLKQMREDPALASTPVILLTAISDRDFVVRARELGTEEYLLKSRFSLKELLARVVGHVGDATAPTATGPATDAKGTGAAPAPP